jgi:hypothetical protein
MDVGILSFDVGLFRIETNVLDALAEGKALCVVEKL